MFSCGFSSFAGQRWEDDRSFKDVMWQRDVLKSAFKIEFPNQAHDNMTYHEAYVFSDAVLCGLFEGIP